MKEIWRGHFSYPGVMRNVVDVSLLQACARVGTASSQAQQMEQFVDVIDAFDQIDTVS